MIALVQRVTRASVALKEVPEPSSPRPGHRPGAVSSIDIGLCVLLAVERGDTEGEADWVAGKLARLRIFPDEAQRMNRSVKDVGGAVLLVSQFTLAGECGKGNRPSFARAAEPEHGRRLYERVAAGLRDGHGLPVRTGVFGAMMQVSLVNDGPVTLIVRRRPAGAAGGKPGGRDGLTPPPSPRC